MQKLLSLFFSFTAAAAAASLFLNWLISSLSRWVINTLDRRVAAAQQVEADQFDANKFLPLFFFSISLGYCSNLSISQLRLPVAPHRPFFFVSSLIAPHAPIKTTIVQISTSWYQAWSLFKWPITVCRVEYYLHNQMVVHRDNHVLVTYNKLMHQSNRSLRAQRCLLCFLPTHGHDLVVSAELLLIAATDARLAWKILRRWSCFCIKWCIVSRIWCCIIDMMRSYFVPIILSPRTNNKNAVVSIHRCNDQLVHQSRSISHPPHLQSDNECLRWTWWCHYPSARRKKYIKKKSLRLLVPPFLLIHTEG